MNRAYKVFDGVHYVYFYGQIGKVIRSMWIVLAAVLAFQLASFRNWNSFEIKNLWLEAVVLVFTIGAAWLPRHLDLNAVTSFNPKQKIITFPKREQIPFSEVKAIEVGFDNRVIKYGNVRVSQLVVVKVNGQRILIAESSDELLFKVIRSRLANLVEIEN